MRSSKRRRQVVNHRRSACAGCDAFSRNAKMGGEFTPQDGKSCFMVEVGVSHLVHSAGQC